MSDIPSTPLKTMEMAREEAVKAGLRFVYLGEHRDGRRGEHQVPEMRFLAVRRQGFYADTAAMTKDGACGNCGEPLNMII